MPITRELLLAELKQVDENLDSLYSLIEDEWSDPELLRRVNVTLLAIDAALAYLRATPDSSQGDA